MVALAQHLLERIEIGPQRRRDQPAQVLEAKQVDVEIARLAAGLLEPAKLGPKVRQALGRESVFEPFVRG